MPNHSGDSNSGSKQPMSSSEGNTQAPAALAAQLKEMQTRLDSLIAQRDECVASNERLRQNFQTTHVDLQQAHREIDTLRFQSALLQKQLSEGATDVIWRLTAPWVASLGHLVRKALGRVTAKAR